MKVLKLFLLLIILAGAAVGWQVYSYFNSPLITDTNRIITVNAGDPLRTLATDLESRAIISSADMFILWARFFGHDKKIKTGEYGIPVNTTMSGLFKILLSGKSLGHRVVVPEGYNMFEVADIMERAGLCKAADFLKLAKNKKFIRSLLNEDRPTLEGYLFPDTYFFTKTDGAQVIVKRMVSHFMERFATVPQLQGWTRHEVVTLASIIEKETGAPFERPQISSVFHNRLIKKMKLQTDPTVLYGKMLQLGKFDINITKLDLVTDNIYNTYTRKGLPAGPIANPGFEALVAAVQPATTDFLFFVSKNDGTHQFSVTYSDHEKAVGSYQLNSRAREGKSWRDLSKQPKTKSPL